MKARELLFRGEPFIRQHGSLTELAQASSVAGVAACHRRLICLLVRFAQKASCAPRLLSWIPGHCAPPMTAAVLTLVYVAYTRPLRHSCHYTTPDRSKISCGIRANVQPRQQFVAALAAPTTQFRAEERRAPLERISARAPRPPRPGGAAARQLDIALAAAGAGSVRVALRARAVRRRAAVGAAAFVHPLRVDRQAARPAGGARRHGGRRDGGRRARQCGGERGRARLCGRRRARVLQGEFILLPARRRARAARRRDGRHSGLELRAFPCVAGNAFLWCLAALAIAQAARLPRDAAVRADSATRPGARVFPRTFDARWDRGAISLSDALCDIGGVCDLSAGARDHAARGEQRRRRGRLTSASSREPATRSSSSTQPRNKRRRLHAAQSHGARSR